MALVEITSYSEPTLKEEADEYILWLGLIIGLDDLFEEEGGVGTHNVNLKINLPGMEENVSLIAQISNLTRTNSGEELTVLFVGQNSFVASCQVMSARTADDGIQITDIDYRKMTLLTKEEFLKIIGEISDNLDIETMHIDLAKKEWPLKENNFISVN